MAIPKSQSYSNLLGSSGLRRNTSATSLRGMLFPSSTAPSSPRNDMDDADAHSEWTTASSTFKNFCGSPPANPLRRLSRTLYKSRSSEQFAKLEDTAEERRLQTALTNASLVRDLINSLVMAQDGEGSKQVRFLFYVWQYEHELNTATRKQMAVGIMDTFLSASSMFQLDGIPKNMQRRSLENILLLKWHFLSVLAENQTAIAYLDGLEAEKQQEEAGLLLHSAIDDDDEDDYM